MGDEYQVGLSQERRGSVLVLTIDRPKVRNALDYPTACAISDALDRLDEDPELALAVVTGQGGTFCSGMDLGSFRATGQRPEVPGRGFAFTNRPPRKPLIAAVEGAAVGGGFELVLACDLVVAAEDAIFGLPEARVGLVAASGGLIRLARKVPQAIAMEYGLTGRAMPATVAHAWGLVNILTSRGGAVDGALALAEEISACAPMSIVATKDLVGCSGLPWDAAVLHQDEVLRGLVESRDAREGTAAFLEKRLPRWEGR